MAQAARPDEFLGFLDQCTVICLEFASFNNGWENIDALRKTAEQELTGKKEDLQRFIETARQFAKLLDKTKLPKQKLMECLDRLKNSLDQKTFDECADFFIEPPVESWEKVSMVLHLICKACEQQGPAKVHAVIQIGVRYMNKTLVEFVSSQGGWKSWNTPQSQGDISSSIVVVQQGDVQEITAERVIAAACVGDAPTSVQDSGSSAKESSSSFENPAFTPTYFETSSPINTDDERDSLSTPPEIVERPLMTESYVQAMGEEAARESNDSESNGFEIVGSGNEGMVETQAKSIDDVHVFEQPEEIAGSVNVQQMDSRQRSEESASKVEGSILGGYLPHISIGVAAAAAVAGFLVLKKNM